MSDPGDVKLPRGADELLRGFPLGEPDFEAQAKAIEATLGVSPGVVASSLSDDDLFGAPELPAEPGEPSVPIRRAPPQSHFAEMARRSLHKPEDDGAALAKELLVAASQARRPDADMVERVRAAGRASATASPLPTGERPSGVVARAEVSAAPLPTDRAPKRKLHPGTIFGIVGTVVSIAACLALVVKMREPKGAPAEATPVVAVTVTPPAAPPPAREQAPVVSHDAVTPEALAMAPREAAPAARGAAKRGDGAHASEPPATSKGAVAGGAVRPEEVVLQDDPEPAKAVAQNQAATQPEPQLKPAEGSTTDVPLNPSSGAVLTALAAVRGPAQACLAGQNEAVTAVVTFAADGHVAHVSAGGPSRDCIQAALMKAHIAPFAKDTFSATTTIRPP